MSEELFPYYERELRFIRQMVQEFARQYPGAAERLLLEPNRSADPHVERLIESFAFLAGRLHHKLDDEFPELTDALFQVLYPNYLAPIPSMGIVQFDLDAARGQFPKGFLLDRHSRLQTAPIQNLPCKYRTAYPVRLWPVKLNSARFQTPPFPPGAGMPPPGTAAALRLDFECQTQHKFPEMSLDTLRLFLFGDNQVVPYLYEAIFNHALQVVFRSLDPEGQPAPIVLSPEKCLKQVGFEKNEGLLPYPPRAMLGYRLLTELFTFPAKFWFVDLGGWERVCRSGIKTRCEVTIFLNRTMRSLEQGVQTGTFRLGCSPIVNLFEQAAEPIPLAQARQEYRIVPNVAFPQGLEVYSVDSVISIDSDSNRSTEYLPFFSFRHHFSSGKGEGRSPEAPAFYYPTRRQSLVENDRGTEVSLHLVDLGFNPLASGNATLAVRTTCTNRDLPTQLQQLGESLTFELEGAAPLARIGCLRPPTAPLRPPSRRGGYWRLVSHLNLNHLSLTDPVEGRAALQEILRLYDFSDPHSGQQMAALNRQMIEGLTSVSSRRVVGRLSGEGGGFCRGLEVALECDEQKYVGTGVFLFASVLERFLALYTSINSFTQLIAKTQQGKTPFKIWPPRAGEMQLL